MRPVQWLDDARAEVVEHTRGYDEAEPGLGAELWDEMERVLAYAQRFPHAATRVRQLRKHDVRRFVLDRFRFTLIVAVRSSDLVVVAFHHQRRDPDYWKPRLAKVRR